MTRRDPPGQAPDELRDEDIRALLDAQPPAVSPADLDARIRREAHAAASPTAPATAPAAPGRTLTTRLGPWVAVAAAVVLTVLLVPLLPTLVTDPLDPMADGRYRSEADLETSASDDQVVNKKTSTQATAPTSGLIIDMAADKRESIAERAPSLQQESAALAVDNASRKQVPAAKMSATSDLADQTAVQSAAQSATPSVPQSVSGAAAGPAPGPAPQAGDSFTSVEETTLESIDAMSKADIEATYAQFTYRRTEDDWWLEILRLHDEGRAQQVVREVRLFERMYPGSANVLPGGDQ